MSYLFTGVENITRADIDITDAVLIDYAGTYSSLQSACKYYYDLSPDANILEAISRVYDVLRWAETKQDAKCVLIINLMD